MPGRVDVCVEVLLRGLASADAVARVIIGEDVAVDASAEADVEAAHLPEVHCISMGEQNRESAETEGGRLKWTQSISQIQMQKTHVGKILLLTYLQYLLYTLVSKY